LNKLLPLIANYPKRTFIALFFIALLVFITLTLQTAISQSNVVILLLVALFFTFIYSLLFLLSKNFQLTLKTQQHLDKLERAIEASSMAICITDENGIIEFTNPKFSELSGYLFNDVIGKKSSYFDSEKIDKAKFKAINKDLNSGQAWNGEINRLSAKGHLHSFHSHITPIKNKDFLSENYIIIEQDITEQKYLQKQIIKSKRRLQDITDNIPVCVYQLMHTNDGKLLFNYVSTGVRKILGYSHKYVIHNFEESLSYITKPEQKMLTDKLKSLTLDDDLWERQQYLWAHSFTVNHPRLGEIFIDGQAKASKTPNGIVWDGYWHDNTEKRKLEIQLDQQSEQLKVEVTDRIKSEAMAQDSKNKLIDITNNIPGVQEFLGFLV